MKEGTFTAAAKKYGFKTKDGKADLKKFAKAVLARDSKYTDVMRRKAQFYVNTVLAKQKGSAKPKH